MTPSPTPGVMCLPSLPRRATGSPSPAWTWACFRSVPSEAAGARLPCCVGRSRAGLGEGAGFWPEKHTRAEACLVPAVSGPLFTAGVKTAPGLRGVPVAWPPWGLAGCPALNRLRVPGGSPSVRRDPRVLRVLLAPLTSFCSPFHCWSPVGLVAPGSGQDGGLHGLWAYSGIEDHLGIAVCGAR